MPYTRTEAVLFFLGVLLLAGIAQAEQPLSRTVEDPSAKTADGTSRFEELLMPGPLIEGHADLEKECSNCHEVLKKASQNRLCLDCHDDVDADLKRKEGYHGLDVQIKDRECKTCHTEHKGRDTDIVMLDKDHFDHKLTDFWLEGRHKTAPCGGCHLPDKKYREAPSQCEDCHREDDPHRDQFEDSCDACHSEESWADARFDHDKTEFPLQEKHAETSCNACHPDERYVNTPMQCFSCHALNDVHAGQNGNECDKCHTEKAWEESTFDHDVDTEFKLLNSHKGITCESCHKKPKFEENPDQACVSCHRLDDEHQGKNGRKCDNCHKETNWSEITFDHDKDTDYELRGKHREVLCTACHQGEVYDQDLSTACIGCHKVDDLHNGEQGEECERCHNEDGWSNRVVFDHDITRFPLIGLHSTLPCSECHISGVFQETEKPCVACHADDDTHKKTLGPDCHLCHTPNAWSIWQFDHDTQTDFILDGSHKNLSCDACHTEPTEKEVELASDCYSCHKGDDAHDGLYGRYCGQCHTTEKFSILKQR